MEDLRSKSKKNQSLNYIPAFLKKQTAVALPAETVSLSALVDEAITDYIGQRPELKATFEVESNIIVQGDYERLRTFIKKLVQSAIRLNLSFLHHSIVFGRVKEDRETYFIMNNELGFNSTKVSFGAFNHLDKKDLGSELKEIQKIIASQNGKFWGIGKKDVGSIFYFSIGV